MGSNLREQVYCGKGSGSGIEPGTQSRTDGVLEDLVDAEEGEDTGLVVGHAQLPRHRST